MNESGAATLTVALREFELDLEEYSSFEKVHGDLLRTMDRYNGALKDLCRVLPRRTDIIRRYGQMVIWTYVSGATKRRSWQTSSLTQTLLGLVYEQDPP
jgi:hypothetical protein